MSALNRRQFITAGSLLAGGAVANPLLGQSEAAAAAAKRRGRVWPTAKSKALPKDLRNAPMSTTNTALDATTGWFVPSDWGQYWRAALNRARSNKGLAVAAIVGDSVGHGYWASNLFSTTWVELLRNELTSLVGYGGSVSSPKRTRRR